MHEKGDGKKERGNGVMLGVMGGNKQRSINGGFIDNMNQQVNN